MKMYPVWQERNSKWVYGLEWRPWQRRWLVVLEVWSIGFDSSSLWLRHAVLLERKPADDDDWLFAEFERMIAEAQG